jgi:hypothetical protein
MWVWRRRRSAGAEENLVDEDSDCRPPPYFGGLLNTRAREHFVLPRPNYREWLAGREVIT